MSNLRSTARKALRDLREKLAESAKKVEQQEDLDKLKDDNKELRGKLATLESRIDAMTKRRKAHS